MAINFPGPYEVELHYTVDGIEHDMRLNCQAVGVVTVGTVPSAIDLNTRNLGTVDLATAVDLFSEELIKLFSSTMSINGYDFYSYAPNSFVRTWLTAGGLSKSGVSGYPTIPAHQSTFTFRTQEGGVMRIVLLDDSASSNVRVPYAAAPTMFQTFMNHVTDPDNWILARDTSYPIAPMNWVGGQNEAVFKSRYR